MIYDSMRVNIPAKSMLTPSSTKSRIND